MTNLDYRGEPKVEVGRDQPRYQGAEDHGGKLCCVYVSPEGVELTLILDGLEVEGLEVAEQGAKEARNEP